MIAIDLIRNNPDLVKENLRKKHQEDKISIVDEIKELDNKYRALKTKADNFRAERNTNSKQIGALLAAGDSEKAEIMKKNVLVIGGSIDKISNEEEELAKKINLLMLKIPNIISPDTPPGASDADNVVIKKYGEEKVPDFEIPYHTDILEKVNGVDLDGARKVAGQGFYFLTGDIARLHSALISYARDFMIKKGFTYVIPPYMIRSAAVDGVMSFEEKDDMMYKIENEDLYLIGTSEHTMIARYMDSIIDEKDLPIMLTSYSPCFRKEKGAHGIEERGIYRVHQFEKQEMIVICKDLEQSKIWYDKMYNYTIEFFLTLGIPVHTLECCAADLADLKYRSVDIETWSPRQKDYYLEAGSCSNLTDAQARRLKIRVKDKDGKKQFVHTLNNTVVAPPRMLIAFVENNLNKDGSINVPEALWPYMGDTRVIK